VAESGIEFVSMLAWRNNAQTSSRSCGFSIGVPLVRRTATSFLKFGSFSVASPARLLNLYAESSGPLIRNPREFWVRVPGGSPVSKSLCALHFSLRCVSAIPFNRQMSMRWIICLLIIALSGCHGASLLERPTTEAPLPIMLLWAHYQRCLVTTDPTEFVSIIDQLESVVSARAEPPSWIRAWGQHVANQPLRTAVDPQALGTACTLRAAAVMAEAEHLMEARALYRRVLARYANREWAYFVDRATEALASLRDSAPAAVTFRSNRARPH
jgi:hypothetical protein